MHQKSGQKITFQNIRRSNYSSEEKKPFILKRAWNVIIHFFKICILKIPCVRHYNNKKFFESQIRYEIEPSHYEMFEHDCYNKRPLYSFIPRSGSDYADFDDMSIPDNFFPVECRRKTTSV